MHIEVSSLVKEYGGHNVLHNLSFTVHSGELLTLLGPSGCGKTTTLRCVAGLEKADAGSIVIGGTTVASNKIFVPAEKRKVGMVYQSYALWPHMTVYENIAYGLRLRRLSKNEIAERVKKILDLMGMYGLRRRLVTDLSGGEQQRVAVARSVIVEPNVLLFDEPLSNLDAGLREHMRFELRNLQKRLGITTIYVTHSQEEAFAIADRIGLMARGKIVQIGTSRELYYQPVDETAASFLGLSNFLTGQPTILENPLASLRTHDGLEILFKKQRELKPGTEATLLVRPRDVKIHKKRPPFERNVWPCKIVRSTFMGESMDCVVSIGEQLLRVIADPEDISDNDIFYAQIPLDKCLMLPDRSHPDSVDEQTR